MTERATAEAHGRVNLIGEHTDYHDGFVLPMIIPQLTRVELTLRQDQRVRVTSAKVTSVPAVYDAGGEQPGRGWLDYVQGVTAMLARAGHRVPGFDLHIESDIPVGAGLSSSAALTVSLLRGLRVLLEIGFDDVTLAKIARSAETDFVGAPVGIMDQMACSLGRDGEALFLDTRTLATESFALPASFELAVIDSGIEHRHAGGSYVARRRESFDAAARLGVRFLRDFDLSDLHRLAALPPLLARRARHIVTENERVLAAVGALRAGNAERLGDLLNQSHRSLSNDYEVSTPDVDLMVSIAQGHQAVFGARMTGGGFGGAIILLAHPGAGRDAAADICMAYTRHSGRNAVVLIPPT
jgi:galactokinase